MLGINFFRARLSAGRGKVAERARLSAGQIFSSDFLVAVVIFMFVLTVMQVHQNNIVGKIEKQQDMIYHEELVSKTDLLVLSSGYPEGWNETTVKVPGLAISPQKLNDTKIKSFLDLSYSEIKDILGLRGREFYLEFKDEKGNLLSDDGMDYEKGQKNWDDSENVYTVQRDVFIEGKEEAEMRLVVW